MDVHRDRGRRRLSGSGPEGQSGSKVTVSLYAMCEIGWGGAEDAADGLVKVADRAGAPTLRARNAGRSGCWADSICCRSLLEQSLPALKPDRNGADFYPADTMSETRLVLTSPDHAVQLTLTDSGLTLQAKCLSRKRWLPFLPGFLESRELLQAPVRLGLRVRKLPISLVRILDCSHLLFLSDAQEEELIALVARPLGPGHCLALFQAMPQLIAVAHEGGIASAPPPQSVPRPQPGKRPSLPDFFSLRPCRPMLAVVTEREDI